MYIRAISCRGISGILLLLACVSLLMLAACSNDDRPTSPDQNAVSVPVGDAPNEVVCDVDLSKSTIPKAFMLSARTGTTLDPRCEYKVTLKNSASQPVQGVKVEVWWSGTSFLHRMVCEPTSPPVPGMTYEQQGDGHLLTNYTDADGVAHFRLGGGFIGGYDIAYVGFSYVRICDNWQTPMFEGPIISTPDLNASGGVNGADLSLFMADLNSGVPVCRSNFNGDQYVNSADLSILLGIMFGGGSTSSCQ